MDLLQKSVLWNGDLLNSTTFPIGDARVQDWPLMQSPWPTTGLIMAYFLMVWLGPKYMAKRAAFELRIPLIIYNLGIMCLNFYIATEMITLVFKLRYNPLCQPVTHSTDPDEMRVLSVAWWFYISKPIEFMDTLFFITRKSDRQLTFLHVYHHSSFFYVCWLGMNYAPGGNSVYTAAMNSVVHVIMYGYYGLSAMGPRVSKFLWWKKYLTGIQIAQFVVDVSFAILLLVNSCDYPQWMKYFQFFYAGSYIFLFGQFYVRSYMQKGDKKVDSRTRQTVKEIAKNEVIADEKLEPNNNTYLVKRNPKLDLY